MMDRLFKSGLVTTILGMSIIITSIVLWTMGKDYEEVAGILAVGLLFVRSKDSLIGLGKND